MKTISSVRDLGKTSCYLLTHVEDLATFWVSLDTFAETTKVVYQELKPTIDSITATLMLDRLSGQQPLDVIEHWL